jgi:hypothetical protein
LLGSIEPALSPLTIEAAMFLSRVDGDVFPI